MCLFVAVEYNGHGRGRKKSAREMVVIPNALEILNDAFLSLLEHYKDFKYIFVCGVQIP